MRVGDSVRNAINSFEADEIEAAMLHACNAVDGTARKVYPTAKVGERFVALLRDNYDIVGVMGSPGIDVVNTRWPVEVQHIGGSKKEWPDFADIVYAIHRCSHGHGDAVPEGFELIPGAQGPVGMSTVQVEPGRVRISDRAIFGLLAVAVLSPANFDQRVPDGFYLTLGDTPMVINEWWGRAKDFHQVAALHPMPLVTLDFTDWTPSTGRPGA